MNFNDRQQAFIREYTRDFNGTQAAIRAGYSERSAHVTASRLLSDAKIWEAIQERVEQLQMTADEAAIRMARIARFDVSKYIEGVGRAAIVDVEAMKRDGYGDMITGVKYNSKGAAIYDLVDSQRALETLYKTVTEQPGDEERPVHIVIKYANPDD